MKEQIKILIQQFKQKILDMQTDNEVFDSLKKTNDKMNINLNTKENEIKQNNK